MILVIGYGLKLEQTQKLVMTPELRQAITVLQLSSLELSQYVEQELLENPFLEMREDSGEQPEETASEPAAGEKEPETDWEAYFADYGDSDPDSSRVNRDPVRDTGYENFVSRAPTLAEHLLLQLDMSSCRGTVKRIGAYLIGNLDEHGYLCCAVEEVCASLHVEEAQVRQALSIVQGFDPAGVGARDLKECLLNQLEQLGPVDPLVRRIIENHLEDLGGGKLNRIARRLAVTVQEVQKAADLIKKLNPKPACNFSSAGETRYIVPDVVLEKTGGDYVIIINDAATPRLTISRSYRSLLGRSSEDPQTRRYLESRLNAASWLIRSIEQRKVTLYRVTECLVELQRDFLDYGVRYLKPLNLRKVAGNLGLHESTVSRATANKYVQTPLGVFEMKYFFSPGLNNSDGTVTSAGSIKCRLQEFVAAEDQKDPLKDQRLVEMFLRQGIKVSRRTIAKYRDELGIPAAARRKRY